MNAFDYFYGHEVEQFVFFRIPKLLITEPEFSRLSDSAKIMYGLFLDRTSLSIKNGWLDDQNRAYVIYSNEEIQDQLKCSKNTVTKVLSEIDTKKGIGLIERIRRGLGKPDIIYVKNFTSVLSRKENITKDPKDMNEPESPKSPENTGSVQNPKIWESRIPKFGNQESQNLGNSNPKSCDSGIPNVGIPYMNNTENNKTDSIDTKKSADPCSLAPKSKKIEIGDSTSSDTSASTQTVLSEKEAELFELFIAERKSRGKKTTILQRKSLIQKLFECGSSSNERTEILEKTIYKGWLDFYPPSHQITPLPSSSISTKTESIDIEPDDPKELLQKLTEKDRASNTFVPFANSYEEENRYGNSCF